MSADRQTDIDDQPQQRESAVRHAHAVQASRHGRASAPGYLGLPASENEDDRSVENSDVEDTDEDAQRSSDQPDDEPQQNPSTRAPRARKKSTTARKTTRTVTTRRKPAQSKASASKRQAKARSSKASSTGAEKSGGSRQRAGRATGSTTKRAASTKARQPSAKSTKRASASRRGSGASGSKPAPRRGDNGRSGRAAAAASTTSSRVLSSLVGGLEEDLPKRAAGVAAKASGKVARRALLLGVRAAARAASRAARRAGSAGAGAVIEHAHRLPIQQSIDVAVPIEVAWEQWLEFDYFPEGTHRVSDVQRDGDCLSGELDGLGGGRPWSAEVLDDRENESFAWRSVEGTDSAGLVTFHPLAERLTRIELNLDVQPVDLAEAAGLVLRIADRRVEAELRRFKAHAELLNPDEYDELLEPSRNGDGS